MFKKKAGKEGKSRPPPLASSSSLGVVCSLSYRNRQEYLLMQ